MSVDLQPLHTFRLPSRGLRLLKIRNAEDVQQLADIERYIILADGSNTLFLEDYDGVVVQPEFYGIEIKEQEAHFEITVGASENWHQLVVFCLDKGIFGLENLALIPGSVGAAPVQNIGAYGVEVCDFIDSVECIDLDSGNPITLTNEQCQFSYRDSLFKRNPERWLISKVHFVINKDWQPNLKYPALTALPDNATAKRVFEHVVATRQSKLPDPIDIPNAGSFFKNPVVSVEKLEELQSIWPDIVYFKTTGGIKLAAGWLIEQLGLKGLQVGAASVHTQQALVLVNNGSATGNDVLALCRHVQQQIQQQCGIELEPEVRLIGHEGLKQELYPK
ncbi:UDP-N-acetylmuramate dehydrogenase [Idiomarina seosinensis]|uniref:UDP-N-acetylenolpyruvoylglucosamine reductase n=1 Tax=Idiomarina seosinensis TaxID=281739 RepID=A0A432Z4F5_9GAMM|nr:UDP-N-acetylmuramate dehydrogenase [Idiomarina seosinensis]RUO72745.1 UDP-N-acetylenolpyruvoylglucosamine reductase [Idiomarina seosinensis]